MKPFQLSGIAGAAVVLLLIALFMCNVIGGIGAAPGPVLPNLRSRTDCFGSGRRQRAPGQIRIPSGGAGRIGPTTSASPASAGTGGAE